VNVPESAVKVDAETWVALNEAVPVTLMSPNVAVDALTALKVPVPFTVMELASMLIASIVAEETTRLVKVPVSFVMVDCVIPESSGCSWSV
jgi:hypothetical protein